MSELEYARQLQQKFEFYLIALAFTIVGLAVQTASFEHGSVAAWFEVGAWVLLLVSGLSGLSRIEWIPSQFAARAELRKIEKDPLMGEALQLRAESLRTVRESIIRKGLIKYRVHKWCFAAGVVALTLARVLPHYDVLFPTPQAATPSSEQSTPAPLSQTTPTFGRS